MKTLNRLIIVAGLLVAYVSLPALAQEIQIVTEEYPPFNYIDPETGQAAGFSTEIVHALLQEVDRHGEINFYPWKRAYLMAQNTPNVLIYSMKRKASREKLFHWVGELVKTKIYFMALKTTSLVPTSDIETLKPYTIGAVRGGSTAKSLLVDGFTVKPIARREQNWKKLKAGRIDLWCTERLSAQHIITGLGDDPAQLVPIALYENVSGGTLYVALSKQTDQSLVNEFREGFIRLQQTNLYQDILKKYGIPVTEK